MLGGGGDLRDAFQDSLNCAIAHGLRPSRWIGLGDETFTAIDAIGEEHTEATADHIAGAYDAFAREHGTADVRTMDDGPGPVEPPKRFVAHRGWFKRS